MTTTFTANDPNNNNQIQVEKAKRTRRPMALDRKADHHKAKDLLLAFFKNDPSWESDWMGLFSEKKQVRVLSNLLLDYVPGFLSAFETLPAPADIVQQCRDVLTAAAPDVAAYRKTHKSIFQSNAKN